MPCIEINKPLVVNISSNYKVLKQCCIRKAKKKSCVSGALPEKNRVGR